MFGFIGVGNMGTAHSKTFLKGDVENGVLTAFLSNQKLNAGTVRTAAQELVESAKMGDPSAVDWLVTLDNGYTIKYVGGGSS